MLTSMKSTSYVSLLALDAFPGRPPASFAHVTSAACECLGRGQLDRQRPPYYLQPAKTTDKMVASLGMIPDHGEKLVFLAGCFMFQIWFTKDPKTYTQNLPNVNPMRKKVSEKKSQDSLDVFLVGRVLLRKRRQQPLSPADQRWDHKLFTAKSNSSWVLQLKEIGWT